MSKDRFRLRSRLGLVDGSLIALIRVLGVPLAFSGRGMAAAHEEHHQPHRNRAGKRAKEQD